jgi:hypothetical protein
VLDWISVVRLYTIWGYMREMFGITVQNVKSVNGQIQLNFNTFALYIKISGIETCPVNLEFL